MPGNDWPQDAHPDDRPGPNPGAPSTRPPETGRIRGPSPPLEPPTGRIVGHARDTLAAIPDGAAGLIITDPPWAIHGGGVFDACANYERLSVADIAQILADGRRALVKGGHLYVFATCGREIVDVVTTFEAHGWRFLRLLGWDKAVHAGMGAYRNSWEPVLIFSNGRTRGYERRQTYSNLLRARSIGRRTAKPWELYEVFIEMSSRPGELVVDPFCGTNPLAKAASRVQPARRWLAGDVLSSEAINNQLMRRGGGAALGVGLDLLGREGPKNDTQRHCGRGQRELRAGSEPRVVDAEGVLPNHSKNEPGGEHLKKCDAQEEKCGEDGQLPGLGPLVPRTHEVSQSEMPLKKPAVNP